MASRPRTMRYDDRWFNLTMSVFLVIERIIGTAKMFGMIFSFLATAGLILIRNKQAQRKNCGYEPTVFCSSQLREENGGYEPRSYLIAEMNLLFSFKKI